MVQDQYLDSRHFSEKCSDELAVSLTFAWAPAATLQHNIRKHTEKMGEASEKPCAVPVSDVS